MLETLFRQSELDFGDLKSARLVCKEWYFGSLPRWRSTAVITVSAKDGEGKGKFPDLLDDEERPWDADTDDEDGQKDGDDGKGQKEVDDGKGQKDAADEKVQKDVDGEAEVSKRYPTVSEYLRFMDADINLRNTNDDNPLLLENKSSAYPFLSVKLINWFEMDQVRDDFWSRIGEHLKYLHLEDCPIVDDLPGLRFERSMDGVINMTVNELPKLTTLAITAPSDSDTRYNLDATVWEEFNPLEVPMVQHHNLKVFHTSGCEVHWSLVFTCFPKIEEIRDSDANKTETKVGSEQSTLFGELAIQPREIQKNLRSIDLIHSRDSKITSVASELMGNLSLNNLTYLSVCLDESIKESEAQNGFKNFFSKNRQLKVWKILREGSAGLPFREFPDGIQMSGLKELHLYGNVTRSMEFIRFTSNLETLVIYFTCEGSQRVDGRQLKSGERFSDDLAMGALRGCDEDQFKPLEKMKNLWVDVELSVRSLGVVGKWMPKLTGLRTVLNKISFGKVCSQWGAGLGELVLLKGSTVDEGMLMPNITSLISK